MKRSVPDRLPVQSGSPPPGLRGDPAGRSGGNKAPGGQGGDVSSHVATGAGAGAKPWAAAEANRAPSGAPGSPRTLARRSFGKERGHLVETLLQAHSGHLAEIHLRDRTSKAIWPPPAHHMLGIAPRLPCSLDRCAKHAGYDQIAFLRFGGQRSSFWLGLSNPINGPKTAIAGWTPAGAAPRLYGPVHCGVGRHVEHVVLNEPRRSS